MRNYEWNIIYSLFILSIIFFLDWLVLDFGYLDEFYILLFLILWMLLNQVSEYKMQEEK